MGKTKSKDADVKEKKTPVKLRPAKRKHNGKVTEPWRIMERLIEDEPELEPLQNAKIKLFWQADWKADVDGIAVGAQVCLANELHRNLAEESGESVDLIIKLPQEQWPQLDETEKEHRIYHELCHIKPSLDANGHQKRDTKDRLLWRLGRHPINAFHEEVKRYGIERVIGFNQAVVESIEHAARPMDKLWGDDDATKGKATEKTKAGKKPEAKSKEAEPAPDWRRLGIDTLAITKSLEMKLREAGIGTLGAFSKHQAKCHNECWWADLTGIGEKSADAISDAWELFWKNNPHYTRAPDNDVVGASHEVTA